MTPRGSRMLDGLRTRRRGRIIAATVGGTLVSVLAADDGRGDGPRIRPSPTSPPPARRWRGRVPRRPRPRRATGSTSFSTCAGVRRPTRPPRPRRATLSSAMLGMCAAATTTTTAAPPSTTSTSTSSTTTTTSLGPAGGSCGGTAPPVAAPAWEWSCSFDDEFNGTSLDSTKWVPQQTATSGYSTGPPRTRCAT